MELLVRGTYSIVLLAVVDSDYKFVIVDVGAYGKQSDGGVLEQSKFGCRLENGKLHIPRDLEPPNTSHPAPCVFVADEGFQLCTDFLRPYPGRGLEGEKRIFNYRLSRARRCAENAFGILVTRWRILARTMGEEPKQAEKMGSGGLAIRVSFVHSRQCKWLVHRHATLPKQLGRVGVDFDGVGKASNCPAHEGYLMGTGKLKLPLGYSLCTKRLVGAALRRSQCLGNKISNKTTKRIPIPAKIKRGVYCSWFGLSECDEKGMAKFEHKAASKYHCLVHCCKGHSRMERMVAPDGLRCDEDPFSYYDKRCVNGACVQIR
ncbi:hypothetical protein MRX96_016521 [Rhipicephalus microplus]